MLIFELFASVIFLSLNFLPFLAARVTRPSLKWISLLIYVAYLTNLRKRLLQIYANITFMGTRSYMFPRSYS